MLVDIILDAVTALLCAPLAVLLIVGVALDLADKADDVLVDLRRMLAETVAEMGRIGETVEG